jgi:hypothetical protein
MTYNIKVIGKNKYQLIELKYGQRIQYIEFKVNKESFQGIINLDKRNEILLPNYLAEHIINKLKIT